MIMATNNLRLAQMYWGPGPLPAGAIIRLPTGLYVQGNAGTLRSVNQADIERALVNCGREVDERRAM